MNLPLGEVAKILGAECEVPERIAQGYSIDSRTLQPGQLFFAIHGPRRDGHEFVLKAFEAGAVSAVVEHDYRHQAPPAVVPLLMFVRNSTQSLQQLAREVRRKWGRRLIAITGSMGKTTTKELVAAALGTRYAVHKSPGNLNNEYGLALSLLGLETHHAVAVVEIAMSGPGEIARLARVAEPEVGIVTNVAPVHLEALQSVNAIARAKRGLVENLQSPAIAILNQDDLRVREFAEGFTGRVVTFGFGEGASFHASEVPDEEGGRTRFRVQGPRLDATFELPLPGRHNAANALAALAAAALFEVPVTEIQTSFKDFKTLHQRCEILTLPAEITVIDDSYNSNPVAMEAMLDTLAAWPGARRRIVVAGAMLELGLTSPEWHEGIGRKVAERGVDWLLAVQGDAQYIVEGAATSGMPTGRTWFFSEPEQAGEFCRAILEPGDLILVKGSRAVGLEKVIEMLKASQEVLAARSRKDAGSAN